MLITVLGSVIGHVAIVGFITTSHSSSCILFVFTNSLMTQTFIPEGSRS